MIVALIVLLAGCIIAFLGFVTVNGPVAAVGMVLTLAGGFGVLISPILDDAYDCSSSYTTGC